jgi:hypothetical protein
LDPVLLMAISSIFRCRLGGPWPQKPTVDVSADAMDEESLDCLPLKVLVLQTSSRPSIIVATGEFVFLGFLSQALSLAKPRRSLLFFLGNSPAWVGYTSSFTFFYFFFRVA